MFGSDYVTVMRGGGGGGGGSGVSSAGPRHKGVKNPVLDAQCCL